jgi:hypothetical protein
MKAVGVKGQSFHFLVVALGRELLAIKRKIQSADTACFDYDFVPCFDGFFRRRYQHLFRQLFAIRRDGYPGVFSSFNRYGE